MRLESSLCRKCKLEATACREYKFGLTGFALKANGTNLDLGPRAIYAVWKPCPAAMLIAEALLKQRSDERAKPSTDAREVLVFLVQLV